MDHICAEMEDVLNEIKELKLVVIGELIVTQHVISKMNEKINTIRVHKAVVREKCIVCYLLTVIHAHIYMLFINSHICNGV